MTRTYLLICAVSLALVLGVVAWEWGNLTSPGALHPSHAAVLELQGSDGCVACHGNDGSAMADACNACHADIQTQIESGHGLHASLESAATQACGACHVEHVDGRLALVAATSFEAAGVLFVDGYDHRHAQRYDLAGSHADLQCQQCHVNAHAAVLPKGQKRYLGLSQECVACHKDPHGGTFGGDCVSCHGQVHAFKDAAGFEHTSQFLLEGGHDGLTCAACHQMTGPTSVAALRTSTLVVRGCVACHEDPHEGSLGNNCASCHGTVLPFDQAAEFKHTEDFPLIGGHAAQACKSCHEATGAYSVAALQSHPLPARNCNQCHASPHSQTMMRLVAGALGGAADTCVACHRAEHESFLSPAATMTAAQHAATGFALAVPHDKVECIKCHAEFGLRAALEAGPDLAQRFAKLYPGRSPNDCAACHKDPHLGQFAKGPTRGRCIDCHATVHFTPCTFDLAQHDKTRFPLVGAHQAVGCAMCHKTVDSVVRFVPTATACADCHKDVHNGKFDGPGKRAIIDGRQGCARCHNEKSFGDITWSAEEHRLWTGYQLLGAHAEASCVDCHKRRERPDAQGRTLGVAPKTCNACHADTHAGQFRRNDVTDCARCHTETAKFTATTFDHQRDSQFKLDEQHISLDCAACHKPIEIAPRVIVIRYRPLGTRCQDCHDSRMLEGKERP